MLHLAIINSDGKIVTAKDLPTAAELLTVAEQARTMIRDCERLAREATTPTANAGVKKVPYAS